MTIAEKLQALRSLMTQHGVDFYYVPSADAHQSEYAPACWDRRPYISGFTGSAGDALIGMDQAYLWTDGRYFLQAEQELDPAHFQMMKQKQGVAPVDGWLADNAAGKSLGVDPRVITVAQAKKLKAAMESAGGKLVYIDSNLIDEVSGGLPMEIKPIHLWPMEYAGESAQDKISRVQAAMTEHACEAMLVNMLDSIAWLFNIRGNDIDVNPLVISYAAITKAGAHFFVDPAKLNDEHRAYFNDIGVTVHDYDAFGDFVKSLNGKTWIDSGVASAWIFDLISSDIHAERLPIDLFKACKNDVEKDGMRKAHQIDGVSLTKFICWLESNWEGLDEFTAAEKLYEMRAAHPDFRSLSFATISGYASNGAVIHYRAQKETALPLGDNSLFLLDSGAQYWQGTTDVTRVMHFGEPTAEHKHHYTLVLKGHLALGRARFVKGTCGHHIDALARQFLWAENLDYLHGTGHGVGCYLCVHEGPQRVSPATVQQPLLPGMVVSNEPGVYLPGKHGIRIENLCLINQVADGDSVGIGTQPFLGFEDLTLVPYNPKLVDFELLTDEERDQFNAYQTRVREALMPEMDEAERLWLLKVTS